MQMPQRPRSHVIEEESVLAFRRVLPPEWTFESTTHDYGTDGRFELVEANRATGPGFLAQLKGTDTDKPGALRRSFSVSTLNYPAAHAEPALLVRYIAKTGGIFGTWLHRRDFILRVDEQSTLETDDASRLAVWERLERRVEKLQQGASSTILLRELSADGTRRVLEVVANTSA